MNIDELCMGCMSVKGSVTVCPYCQWEDTRDEDSKLFLSPGTILNHRYLLGRVLGHGGFGVTYLGFDLDLKIKLAIKEYFPIAFSGRNKPDYNVIVLGDEEEAYRYGLQMFLEEAMVLAKLSTIPGIVTVRDYFAGNNTAYLVMYYMEGMTFKEFLQRNNELIPYDVALTILLPAMAALDEIHKHNILHRDISPDNIYITKDRQVKLLDFGAARQVFWERSRSLDVILKKGYAPEEQYRRRGKQGPWTDVYAVGATLYRAIVGAPPPDALERMENDSLVTPSRLGHHIPPHIENAMMKALSYRAADRYQTMKEFYNALTAPQQNIVRINQNQQYQRNQANGANTGCITLVMGIFITGYIILKFLF